MPSNADKMAALKKIKDKEKGESDEEKPETGEDTEDEGTEGGAESDEMVSPPDIGDAGEGDDIEPPDAAGGEPGGAGDEGVDTPGADMAEGMLPEADGMGTTGAVIAETLGISPEAGRSLYEAAISIPKFADMDEEALANLMDSDLNVRMQVEMAAAKKAKDMAGSPEDLGMGPADMGAGPGMGEPPMGAGPEGDMGM